jgi:hypothetical protein
VYRLKIDGFVKKVHPVHSVSIFGTLELLERAHYLPLAAGSFKRPIRF